MSRHPHDPSDAPTRDERAARLLDDVAAIEDRLDPGPAKRGQFVADVITLVVVAVLWVVLKGDIRYPLLLAALLVAARGVTRLLPALAHRSLRRDRDRLLAERDGVDRRVGPEPDIMRTRVTPGASPSAPPRTPKPTMPQTRHARLAVFDMVGTTVESGDEVPSSFREALKTVGVELSDEVVGGIRGRSKRDAISRLIAEALPAAAGDTHLVEAVYARFQHSLRTAYRTTARAMPGAERVFDELQGAGVMVVLNTGLDGETARLLLAGLGWEGRGLGLVTGDDVGRGRPAPDLIQAAMGGAGLVDPGAVVAVGDTTSDLDAAAAAGVGWSVGVLSGAHTRGQLEAHPHSVILPSVVELPAWLRHVGALPGGSVDTARPAPDAPVEIRTVDPGRADARWCLDRYFEELQRRFEGGFDPGASLVVDHSDLVPPHGAFLVASIEGRPVACGAVKCTSPGIGYIKRMWVDGSLRGFGLGRRMLAALEEAAATLGCDVVQLETNRALTEAIRLYRTSGYREVEPFNDEVYAHHWFEKRLGG